MSGVLGLYSRALAPVRPRTGYKSARMYARQADPGRIDPDYYERSPSTGAEETARILDALAGYDHEPPADDPTADEPVTIDAVPPVEEDGRTDTDTDADPAPRSPEVSA